MNASVRALKQYQAKRNFSVTPEPAASADAESGALAFVIQKHWARKLHYDFRLELDGTMKSWAVPKGPSFDSRDKRMAVHVEDHPVAYASFEGTIPPKQYGAGRVLIWDRGTWVPLGNPQKSYRAGVLKFELHGEKLHGKWVLVRMKSKAEKQEPWLLIKEKDEFVRSSADFSVVDEFPDSVAVPTTPPRGTSRHESASGSPSVKVRRKAKPLDAAVALPSGAIKAALPEKLSPQLATLVDIQPTVPQDWLYEIKFDGYRLLTRIDGTDIKLFTRNGNDWTSRLQHLHSELARLKLPRGWYDGEIVVANEDGVPDFGALQQSFDSDATRSIVLYLFDLPYFGGHDLRGVTLASRRAVLERVLQSVSSDNVRLSEVFDAPLQSVISSACKLGLEGIVAKRHDSKYVSRRSPAWIKLKCGQRQEFVVGGYTTPKGARVGIGALLLGVHDDEGALRYAGKVGTGFNDRTLVNLAERLAALSARASPFPDTTAIEGHPRWVKPKLVAEVSFGEWSHHGHLRHPVFLGLRTDKEAKTIVREQAQGVTKASKPGGGDKMKTQSLSSNLRVTHPERIIDPSTGITKLDLVRYYNLVGSLMIPHLKGRPVSLVRAPDGVKGELFFQKHAETRNLPGIRQLDQSLDPGHPSMLEVADRKGLLSAAQWNVVEFHTVNASSKAYTHPDRMVFDLDPGAGAPWTAMLEAAELVHAFLKQIGLTAFLKTSGGKGLHVVVPVRKVHDWHTVQGFSQAIVAHIASAIPERFVAKSGPKNRVGKIFIDYLRNRRGATTACAWSARARPGMGISVPVEWSVLGSLTAGDQWNVRTVHTRLDRGNEPWIGYARAARQLTAAMKMLAFRSETPQPAKPVRRIRKKV